MLPEDMTAEIQAELQAYLADPSPLNQQVQALARRFQILPVHIDWSAFAGFAVQGTLVWVDYESPHRVVPVDPHLTAKMLVQAGLQYQRLSRLVPQKTASSRECSMCGGTGRPLFTHNTDVTNIMCECAGLGWLP